jgi:glycerol kinase
MRYILALDQGTTSSRALVINELGDICAMAQKEFKQYFPKPGYVEHDPEEIWVSQYAVANEALAKAKITASHISGIGITNQRETTILWDRKTGKPIHPAIVWQDRRTSPLCEELKNKGLEPLFKNKTGLLLDPYFSATKICYLLDHVKGARKKAEKGELAFGTVDSWLIWKLSLGKLHITDATNASRTLLFNIHTMQWDDELLNILNIPKSILPQLRNSSEVYGQTAPHVFTAPIPIAGIAGDQQAALFGQGCFEVGTAKATYGTGCFILMNTGNTPVISENKLLTTIAIKIGDEVQYALEGSVFISGAAILWLRDGLKIIQKSADVDILAQTVPDTGGVYFVPAFTGLGAPYWDPHARGTILGISRGTTNAHIARATLESIAYQASDVFHAMEADAKYRIKEIRVDGGSVVSNLLMQFQADLMGSNVLRPKMRESTGLGAAFLAGLSVGVWKNKDEIKTLWKLDRSFTPKIDEAIRLSKMKYWKKAVLRSKEWET